ncbi:hypothetical protein Q7P37_005524 [Cladosporium fusiforme]
MHMQITTPKNGLIGRRQLVRDFVAIGHEGRLPFWEKVQNSGPPSPEQISEILKPTRPPILRGVGERISSECPNFVWLRTDYDNEDQHESFITDGLDGLGFGENLSDEGIILSDKRYYDWSDQWQRILDFLPEVVAFNPEKIQKFCSDECLQQEYDRVRQTGYIFHENAPADEYAKKTCRVHNQCATRLVIIEDKETFANEEPTFKAIWLDDCGVVVRTTLSMAEMLCLYLSDETFFDRTCANSDFTFAEIGPEYLPGARRGPALASS